MYFFNIFFWKRERILKGELITEYINRKLIYRLVIRDLLHFFQRKQQSTPRKSEPQNIWEGNYFRELDEYIERDNLQLQEIYRATNRLIPVELPEDSSSPKQFIRNWNLLYSILDEMNLHISLVKKAIFIHKEYGMFEISLEDAQVYFIPSHCLGCYMSCPNKKRHLCIINQGSWNGWANIELTPLDLLLLSKVIALENDLFPEHVKAQINRSFYCHPPGESPPKIIIGLRDELLRELNRLRDIVTERNVHRFIPNPESTNLMPPRPLTARAALQAELRELFRRRRRH